MACNWVGESIQMSASHELRIVVKRGSVGDDTQYVRGSRRYCADVGEARGW